MERNGKMNLRMGHKQKDIRNWNTWEQRIKIKKQQMPDTLSLTQNWRTHQGILDFAASLVDVLTKMFPESIDKLQRETSVEHGESPALVMGMWK